MATEYQLSYTASEIDSKLGHVDGKADASTTTTAGTYGKYSPSTTAPCYYIPNITVNEQGVVTGASQSYLGIASSKSSGIMTSSMYGHALGGGHVVAKECWVSAPGEADIVLSGCATTYVRAIGYVANVYNVYVRDPASGKWKPFSDFVFTNAGVVTVNVTDDHINDSGEGVFLVFYEKEFGASTSSM